MRLVAGLAGLMASVCVASAADAALMTYTFAGAGSGELGGTAFTDKAFSIVLVGDADQAVDPYGLGTILAIGQLESAKASIEGLAAAQFTSPTHLGIYFPNNIIYFGFAFGGDYLDLTISDADEASFRFTAPYGPVTGAPDTFGQFHDVATTQGALALTSVRDVTFAVSPGPTGAVPEPAAWALMVLGFGGAGALLRRRPWRGALRGPPGCG